MTAYVRPAGVKRSDTITFTFDGVPVVGHQGESVVAALAAADVGLLRHNRFDGTPRGAFCLMGVCQECVVELDGKRVEACRTAVTEGMAIRSLRNLGP
jgi:D-hydroxyproline dehydrogenase subunit gamma